MGENRPSGSSTVNLSAIITPPKNANAQVDYEFETHMRYLRGLSEKYLIIIDHFDALPYAVAQSPEHLEEETVPFQNDPQISNVLQLPCRLLFFFVPAAIPDSGNWHMLPGAWNSRHWKPRH